MPLALGEELPRDLLDTAVERPDGGRVPIRELLDGPTLLVFLRHFGCPHCGRQVDGLIGRLPELDALGVRVVLIGNGPSSGIEPFQTRYGISGRKLAVVVDPTLAAFRALGLFRSLRRQLSPRAVIDEIRAFAEGYSARMRGGDFAQLGGALLVTEDRRVAYLHRSERPGDIARGTDVVAAALRLVVERRAVEGMV